MNDKLINQDNAGSDIDEKTGQPIEEAEDNLSRHSTRDSSPPVEEMDKQPTIPAQEY